MLFWENRENITFQPDVWCVVYFISLAKTGSSETENENKKKKTEDVFNQEEENELANGTTTLLVLCNLLMSLLISHCKTLQGYYCRDKDTFNYSKDVWKKVIFLSQFVRLW